MRRSGVAVLAVLGLVVVACSERGPDDGTNAPGAASTTHPTDSAPTPSTEPESEVTAETLGGGDDVVGDASDPTADAAGLFLHPPDRTDVGIQLDDTNSVTIPVGRDGGVLRLTTADGVEVSLSIPPDALLRDAEITMTAIAGIEGFPTDGGLVAGVHLEPDGLAFLRPALLAMSISADIPLDELVGFEYAGAGEDLHRTMMFIEDRAALFPVLHFSGRAVGRGTTDGGAGTGAGTSAERSPGQACNAARDGFNQIVEARRVCGPQENCWAEFSDTDVGNVESLLSEWYTGSVLPRLDEAAAEPRNLNCALNHWLEWRQAAAAVFPAFNPDSTFSQYFASETASEEFAELVAQSEAAAANAILGAYSTARDRCRSGRFDHALVMLTVGAASEQFASVVHIEGERPTIRQAQLDAEACLTFRVDLVSTISLTGDVPYSAKATAGVLTTYDFVTGEWSGSGPIRLSGLRWPRTLSDPCVRDLATKSGMMTCERLVLPGLLEEPAYPQCGSCGGADPSGGGNDNSDPDDGGDEVSLQFSPGLPREVQVTSCPVALPPELLHNLWTTYFGILHLDEIVSGDIEGEYTLLFEEFDVPGDRLYATMTSTLSDSSSGETLSEDTKIEIWHAPQR